MLSEDEHAEVAGLARSTKTEQRLSQRARIVLLAAAGTATRDETGNRGEAPKYGLAE